MRHNLLGQTFGRLFVVSEVESIRQWGGHIDSAWQCRCECGKNTIVTTSHLLSGNTRSCGCLNKDGIRDRSLTHGCCRIGKTIPEYYCWKSMLRRCQNTKSANYYLYGARGITVYEEWNDIHRFLKDVGSRPSSLHSLHRIDNDKGYYPGNVKWATPKEQQAHTRNCHMVIYEGLMLNMTAQCERFGINRDRVRSYLRRGVSMNNAFDKVRKLTTAGNA